MKTQPKGPALDRCQRHGHCQSHTTIQTGFLRDTVVLTRRGEIVVQDIKPRDHVITRGTGMVQVQVQVQVQAVGKHRALLRAISIAAGSLGDTRPDCDIALPADQKFLIRDWRAEAMFNTDQALVPVSSLVDGELICDQGLQVLVLYSLQLDQIHVIYAGGLEMAGATSADLDQRSAS